MKKELEITSLIRRIQTTEGLIRESLDMDNQRWEQAMKKFSFHQRSIDNCLKSIEEKDEEDNNNQEDI